MATPRFRRRALKGYREAEEPTLGELDTPVTIARSNKVPVGAGEWKLSLTPYTDEFAKFEAAPARLLYGENADYTATHVFTVRWHIGKPPIEVRDYVIRGNNFYKVEFTKSKGRRQDWMVIYAVEHFEKDSPVTVELASPAGNIQGADTVTKPTLWKTLPNE